MSRRSMYINEWLADGHADTALSFARELDALTGRFEFVRRDTDEIQLEDEAEWCSKFIADVADDQWYKLPGRIIPDKLESYINERYWSDYINYLNGWAASHTDPLCYGLSPAGFNEWQDNEEQEEDDELPDVSPEVYPYLKTVLHDDDTEQGGTMFYGETLLEFLNSVDDEHTTYSMKDINKLLIDNGIKPITIIGKEI